MEGLEAFARHVEAALRDGAVRDKDGLHSAKRAAVAATGLASLPTDRALAAALPLDVRERFQSVLRTKPMRSQSGVAVVAVMSSPAACPHGKCSFCPGGPDVGSPQSYTGFEPSTMRAKRHAYDPYRIVRDRLAQLQNNGHAIDKVDVVVQGGTFPARDMAYQDWFIAGIYAGLNDGAGGPEAASWQTEEEWRAMAAEERARELAALQASNEHARCRAIGLTIETKPDWCLEPHLDAMLRHGATRIELGLQTLDEDVLRATHRGHTLEDSRRAMQLARDAGFKVCVHVMPGLPRVRKQPGGGVGQGSGDLDPDPEADLEDFRRLFADACWRPDMLKVYPTLVVHEGETLLKRQWREGRYHPLTSEQAAVVVARAKSFVPAWCRIQRVDRDIPTTHVEAGVLNSNLRQLAQAERARMGLPPCRCLRCREPANREAAGARVGDGEPVLRRDEYEASGGTEVFLSFEDPASDAVLGYLRLRRVSTAAHRPEARPGQGPEASDVLVRGDRAASPLRVDAAWVRELKVLGRARGLGAEAADDPEAGAFQHQGLGGRLLAAAERIAFEEWGVKRLLVIAGPGVKPYYRRHGYTDLGPYVAKDGHPHA